MLFHYPPRIEIYCEVGPMKVVGEITDKVIELLGLTIPEDRNIYFAESNLEHMKSSHPKDFTKYGIDLELILAEPDYVGQNPSDGSIEYVKEYIVAEEYVKVAVRLSNRGRYYARSLYVLNSHRVERFIERGTLKKLDF